MKKALSHLMIRPDATLMTGLRAIDRSGYGIAFVCDSKGRLLGTLSDGDGRRAILRGAAPNSRCLRQAMHPNYASVGPSASRAEVLDLMRARGVSQVPVVDAANRLVGLHLLREYLDYAPRPNWALLVAGGRGVRLRPLTDHLPKPMLLVAGRPILERLVLHLVGSGIRHIFLAINHLGHIIEEHFGDGFRFGCQIRYLREATPLGTGGALSLLPRPLARHPLLVMNGDLVTQVDVGRLLDFHVEGRFAATIGVHPFTTEIPYGVAEVRGRRLVALREKPTQRMLVNAGIYVVSPSLRRMVPPNREFPITELFTACLKQGLRVGAHVVEEDWVDIGLPDELRRARGEL